MNYFDRLVSVFNSFMTEDPIGSANQWTSFYMLGTSVMKELNAVTQWRLKYDHLKKNGSMIQRRI